MRGKILSNTAMSLIFIGLFGIFIGLFGFITPGIAQIIPPEKFPHEIYKSIKPDENITYGRLPNGLKYAIKKRNDQAEGVSLRMRITGGTLNEDANQTGLIHFVEHMAFNGSENIPEGEMVKILERIGVKFGTDNNAFTYPDSVIYKLDIPTITGLETGLDIFRETADRLTLSDNAIDKERGVILSEIIARDNVKNQMAQDVFKKIYPDTLFAKRMFYNDKEIIENTKRDNLLSIYKKFYRPDTSFIVVVGNVDVANVEKLLAEKFSDWKKPVRDNLIVELPEPVIGKIETKPYNVDAFVDERITPRIMFINSTPYVAKEDNDTARLDSLIFSVINTASWQRISKRGAYVNSPIINGRFRQNILYKSIIQNEAEFIGNPQANWRDMLKMADTEYRRIIEHGFSEDEINYALNILEVEYKENAERYDFISNADNAQQILNDFGNNVISIGSKTNFEIFQINRKKINAEIVNKKIKETWGNPQLYISLNKKINDTKENSGANDASNNNAIVSEYWGEIRNKKVQALELKVNTDWRYNDFGLPTKPISTEYIKPLEVTKVKFPNNVNLLIRRVPDEAGIVAVNVNFGDPLANFPKDRVIDSGLIKETIIGGGVKKYKGHEMLQSFAGKKIKVGIDKYSRYWSLYGTTSHDDLEQQMQILAAYANDPAFYAANFNKTMSIKTAYFKSVNSNLGQRASIEFLNIVYGGDARYIERANEVDFGKTNRDEIVKLYRNAISNGPMEIVIVGDVDVQGAIDAVGKTFGAFGKYKNAIETTNTKFNGFPTEAKTYNFTHNAEKSQALVTIAWPSQDGFDGKRKRTLQILNAIFQDRLNSVIREEMTSSYSPSTYSFWSEINENNGVISTNIIVKPEDIDRVIMAVKDIGTQLQKGEITQDMFMRAKTPLIAKLNKDKKTNNYWINALSWSTFSPIKIKIAEGADADYQSISLSDVKTLAKINFDNRYVQVIKFMPDAK